MAADEDRETPVILPRGTVWRNASTPLAPGEDDAPEPAASPTRSRQWRTGVFALLVGGTALLGVLWWGAMAPISFVTFAGHPMLDFLVLSALTIAWLAFVWRLIR